MPLPTPPKIFTTCYPLREPANYPHVLLGRYKDTPKARRLGLSGKLDGFGDKFELQLDSSVAHSVIRETLERSGLRLMIQGLFKAGQVLYRYPHGDVERHYFFGTTWSRGHAEESQQMKDIQWYRLEELPFGEMVQADAQFTLLIQLYRTMKLGQMFKGTIVYDEEMHVVSHEGFQRVSV